MDDRTGGFRGPKKYGRSANLPPPRPAQPGLAAMGPGTARAATKGAADREKGGGEVLGACVAGERADVLGMGAYGHARGREFILGGATRNLLSKPPLPILFSH